MLLASHGVYPRGVEVHTTGINPVARCAKIVCSKMNHIPAVGVIPYDKRRRARAESRSEDSEEKKTTCKDFAEFLYSQFRRAC